MARKTARGEISKLEAATTSPLVLTVGHSTRTIDDFIQLLQEHSVTYVADVRTIPRSRHNPQFNKEALPKSLKRARVGYAHFPGLGGLRHPNRMSPNTGWRNNSFRGFADYMQTREFELALEEALQLAGRQRLALMCAEAVPWRCHRSLIADALLVRGIRVEHIMSPTNRRLHTLTPFAEIRGTHLTYPVAETLLEKCDSNRITSPAGKSTRKPRGRSTRL
jgi:uncharacterized protein (DUF488 family)